MVATTVLIHSLSLSSTSTKKLSFRPFNKHLVCSSINNNSHIKPSHINLKNTFFDSQLINPASGRKTHFGNQFKCLYANVSSSEFENPTIKNVSFSSLKSTLSQLTPFEVCKWAAVICIPIAAVKWVVNLVLSPFFWMYFSWTWLFWPWFLAVSLAFYGVYCFYKHFHGKANVFEQLTIVTSAFTWLTLVPPAHFNGYLEGWPFVFFFVYHYFFFFNVSVRKRLYGDYYGREHDPKWDVALPVPMQVLFGVGIMVGHWFAAMEAPELHLIPGGWSNLGIWVLIMLTLFMQYHSTLYLAKYSEKVVVPTAVVQFGPYRWVRHPIYASVMLLFATYFIALRAPLSLLYLVAVCLVYYDQKAKLEEGLMMEAFGERYKEYMNKVRHKFIPFVY
ncbi:hypothetical protein GIB67_040517 [Kingdonia uniflora]|uniref:Uncharacterized protein n=1 Tax=Kingdonia uniflora TaxID=39325 RepID=A0A7J7L5H2_9MAGN|nr:hypothetical protein GIB67_040517 [Kingdonia uniflora]